MKRISIFSLIIAFILLIGCNVKYSFTGGSTGDAKTIQVDYFPNNAPFVEPTVSQVFTNDLQDLFTRQTNLKLTNSGGDLHFEGEIIGFRSIPISATADQTAAQNRLTITVRVRFYNRQKPEDDFDKTFSHFYDYNANQQINNILDDALDVIFDRITQDIFNASVAKW